MYPCSLLRSSSIWEKYIFPDLLGKTASEYCGRCHIVCMEHLIYSQTLANYSLRGNCEQKQPFSFKIKAVWIKFKPFLLEHFSFLVFVLHLSHDCVAVSECLDTNMQTSMQTRCKLQATGAICHTKAIIKFLMQRPLCNQVCFKSGS